MNRYRFADKSEPMPGAPGSCPKCGQEQHCPCVHCADRNSGLITWKWQEDGECMACGKCGLTLHADQWMHIEMESVYRETWNEWKREGLVRGF